MGLSLFPQGSPNVSCREPPNKLGKEDHVLFCDRIHFFFSPALNISEMRKEQWEKASSVEFPPVSQDFKGTSRMHQSFPFAAL